MKTLSDIQKKYAKKEEKPITKSKPASKAKPKKPKQTFKDRIIQSIIDYKGNDPDLISLRDNWIKPGRNGKYSQRHVLNVIKLMEEMKLEKNRKQTEVLRK